MGQVRRIFEGTRIDGVRHRAGFGVSMPFICLSVILTLAALGDGSAAADVSAHPTSLRFDSHKESATVSLKSDGKPIPAEHIGKCRLMASGHDYSHMFAFDKADGKLTLTPTKFVEVGSYQLVIDCAPGAATVTILTPLASLPDVVEQRAKRDGVSKEEARKRLGLYGVSPRPVVNLQLPETYYDGQAIRLKMPGIATETCEWSLNGKVVQRGAGKDTFRHVFQSPGSYTITYREKKDGVTLAEASAKTTVKALPAIQWEVPSGVEAPFEGPPNFRQYTWKVDGTPFADSRNVTYRFQTPGKHLVECFALGPENGPEDTFVHYSYHVTVKPS